MVLGTFVQFYMRAGVFTDGGKKEREQRDAAEAGGPADEPRPAMPPERDPKTVEPALIQMRRTAVAADRAPGGSTMRRIGKLIAGLVLAARWRRAPRPAAEKVETPGTGPAYELVGKVPVMHEGRVKPLDTVAREEVKQVYGRETIKLRDPHEEVAKHPRPREPRTARTPPSRRSRSGGPSALSRLDGPTPSTGTTSRSSSSIISRCGG